MQAKHKFMKIKRNLKQCINQNDLQIFEDVVKNNYKTLEEVNTSKWNTFEIILPLFNFK